MKTLSMMLDVVYQKLLIIKFARFDESSNTCLALLRCGLPIMPEKKPKNIQKYILRDVVGKYCSIPFGVFFNHIYLVFEKFARKIPMNQLLSTYVYVSMLNAKVKTYKVKGYLEAKKDKLEIPRYIRTYTEEGKMELALRFQQSNMDFNRFKRP